MLQSRGFSLLVIGHVGDRRPARASFADVDCRGFIAIAVEWSDRRYANETRSSNTKTTVERMHAKNRGDDVSSRRQQSSDAVTRVN